MMCMRFYHLNYFPREDPFAKYRSFFINLVAETPAMVDEGEYIFLVVYITFIVTKLCA